MATDRGHDGSMTYATSGVAELRVWEISGVDLSIIEDTVKGDGIKTFKGGILDPGMVTASVYLDGSAAGQGAWIASVLAGTAAAVAFVCTSDTGHTFSFNAIPTGFRAASPEGDTALVEGTLTAKISGTITMAWS